MATTHLQIQARREDRASLKVRQTGTGVQQQRSPSSASVTDTGPKGPLVTVTGPGPTVYQMEKLNHECSERSSDADEDTPHLLLPKRKGITWTEQQFLEWYAGDKAGKNGDACSPSDTRRKLMKLARRLVNRRKIDSVFVHPSLRCDAPAHTVTKSELLSNYPKFVEQFVAHPDALDILLALAGTNRLIIQIPTIKQY